MSAERAQQLLEAGIWLRLSGDHDGARRLFEQALRLDPSNEKAKELVAQSSAPVPRAPTPVPAPARPAAPANPFSRPADLAPPSTLDDWGMATGFVSGVRGNEQLASAPVTRSPVPSGPSSIRLSGEGAMAPRQTPPIFAGQTSIRLDGAGSPPEPPRSTPPLFSGDDQVPIELSMADEAGAAVEVPLEGIGEPIISSPTMSFGTPLPTSKSGVLRVPVSSPTMQLGTPAPAGQVPKSSPTMSFGTPAPLQSSASSIGLHDTVITPNASTLIATGIDEMLGGEPATDPAAPAFAQLPPDSKEAWRWPTPEPFPVAPPDNRLAGQAVPWPSSGSAVASSDALDEVAWEPATTGDAAALDLLSGDASQETAAPATDYSSTDVKMLLNGARELLELDDHSGAMELILKAQAVAPNDPDVALLRTRSETTLLAMYESKLGRLDTLPKVKLKDDEVIWLNLDHRAGFVLAQIDGTVTFDDLFAVCGMSRLDTARILAQLVDEGVISRG